MADPVLTPLGFANSGAANVATLFLNISADVAAGQGIIVACRGNGTMSLSDGLNTYLAFAQKSLGGVPFRVFYVPTALALASGSEITLTNTSAGKSVIAAWSVDQLLQPDPADRLSAGQTGTASTFTEPSGALSQPRELLLAVTNLQNAQLADTLSDDPSWISLGSVTNATNYRMFFAAKLVGDVASVAYAPTFTSRTFMSFLAAFKLATAETPGDAGADDWLSTTGAG